MAKVTVKNRPAPPANKSPPPPKPSENKALAHTRGNLPADLAGRMAQDAGKGLSQRQEDNLVPMIVVLQKGSPQCEKKDAKYMEGAEAGVIWLKNAAEEPLVSGEEGIVVQPCQFEGPDWVEWRPRSSGGGFIARHPQRPEDAKEMVDPQNKDRKKWVRPNGNEVIETRYHIVRVFRENGTKPAYVIPLSSTGHTVSKDWMFRMNNIPAEGGGIAPSFSNLWRLTTKFRENQAGNWYQLQVEHLGWVESVEDYEQGLALHTAFAKGEKQMDTSQMEHTGGGGTATSNDGRM